MVSFIRFSHSLIKIKRVAITKVSAVLLFWLSYCHVRREAAYFCAFRISYCSEEGLLIFCAIRLYHCYVKELPISVQLGHPFVK